MIKKEYLTVTELSNQYKLGARNIRKTIDKIKDNTTKELLYKDKNKRWLIHHILIPKFKPIKQLKTRYYALSVDLCRNYTESDIHAVMKFVCERMENPKIEINYTIEKKKANEHSHLHCFINCKQKRKLIENLRLGFSSISFKEDDIWDFEGWKQYITKEGNQITTIKY